MRKFLIALALSLCLQIALPVAVFAIADPDSPPQVSAVYVYEDLLETGDVGVLIDYYLDYAVPPTETATEAYLGVFVDTDGTTQLKAVAPYTFVDSGYGRGLIWIYFTAAEVVTYSITSADVALYDIWLVGNPTLAWVGDPPKTTVGIDYWMPTDASPATLLALRVLYYADVLELAWALDMIEETPLGSRLTVLGESYFSNVIPNLRTMAPSAFASGEIDPIIEDLDYSTVFGATMADGTGTVAGSPITLVSGSQSANVTANGTFILELEQGTIGTVTSDVGIVTGSPVVLVAGINTITTTGIGNITVDVELSDTQTGITGTLTGTGFDLTEVATVFGMSTILFSGFVWLGITILICAAVYRLSGREGYAGGAGKAVMLVFNICIIGGAVMGFLPVLVAVLMFIGSGALIGYVVFFKSASI